jgi:hypothetical protein
MLARSLPLFAFVSCTLDLPGREGATAALDARLDGRSWQDHDGQRRHVRYARRRALSRAR